VTFTQTPRTTPHRKRERVSYVRATAHAIIDEALYCHLGFMVDDTPVTGDPGSAPPPRPHIVVLPTLHARLGDTLYLHGSTGSGPMLAARGGGLPVCVTVTHLDGLVLARSWTNHSANYRCVVVHGRAHLVTDDEEKWRALTAFVDKVGPGRSTDSRPPTPRELAETAVLALTLREASVKARVGGVKDDTEDLGLPYWAGVVPLRLTPGRPEPDAGVTAPLPAYLRADQTPDGGNLLA
jgi:nitroimidazol reductase NimA-like FMN-containing flavoprotein (pyridoxamine 5'-phosphate oxidase superfamily)